MEQRRKTSGQLETHRTSASIEFHDLGLVSYTEGRAVQRSYIDKRLSNRGNDTILFCEHPPTLTLGRLSTPEDIAMAESIARLTPLAVTTASRGGKMTYHGPGQLVIYPVISLPGHRLGVRSFTTLGLESIVEALSELGIEAAERSDQVGVWCGDKKIAQVGLKIEHGVTDHGFAVNISMDMSIFSLFKPCGLDGLNVTSVAKELERASKDTVSVKQFSKILKGVLAARLGSGA